MSGKCLRSRLIWMLNGSHRIPLMLSTGSIFGICPHPTQEELSGKNILRFSYSLPSGIFPPSARKRRKIILPPPASAGTCTRPPSINVCYFLHYYLRLWSSHSFLTLSTICFSFVRSPVPPCASPCECSYPWWTWGFLPLCVCVKSSWTTLQIWRVVFGKFGESLLCLAFRPNQNAWFSLKQA